MTIKDIRSLSVEELIQQVIDMQKLLDVRTTEIIEVTKKLEDVTINYNELQNQYNNLDQKYKLAIAAKYQSQKQPVVLDMPTLFDDAEMEALKVEEEENEVIEVPGYSRKKIAKEKHIDYDSLEHKIETLPIPEGENICDVCGQKMKVKKYEEKEELVYIPSKLFVRVTRIPVLECVNCQSINEEGKSNYHMISHKNFLYGKSKCSPELLAYIIDMKYGNGLPLYTIEKMFEKQGVILPRQNMSNWVIKSAQYLRPIYDLMKLNLISSHYVHADETRTQVLNEEGKLATSTSYMFVYTSNQYDKPIVLYEYSPSRSGDNPKEFLKDFTGCLTTDAYTGYNKVDGIIRTMCNVHAFRYFREALCLLPQGKGRAKSDEALTVKKYQEIIHLNNTIEAEAKEKYPENVAEQVKCIQKRREIELKSKLDDFSLWLERIAPRNKGRYAMNKAIQYYLNHKEELTYFIYDGYVCMNNSICERNIRPFVVIRNRCKFYVSTSGAEVSAMIYSIVITCVENGVNPYMYFTHLFENLPNMDLNDTEALRKLLPYSEELPLYLKTLTKKQIKTILKEYKIED